VDTLMPLDPTTLPANVLRPDEIHLNDQGAVLFTSALGAELPKKVGQADRRYASRF
jgi:hypothetical protein